MTVAVIVVVAARLSLPVSVTGVRERSDMSEALDKVEALAEAYLHDFLDVEEVSPKQEQMLLTAGMIVELAAIRVALEGRQ